MATPPTDPPHYWRCRAPLTDRTVTVTETSLGTDPARQWEFCSWACTSALVTNQIRTGDDEAPS